MPRKPIDPNDPDKLQHYVPTLFSGKDLAVIERVAEAYGMSRGSAVRLMMRHGAKKYDPQPGE
jgi:hypothetical protein